MADCQSLRPCAPLGLLPLLVGLISFHLPEVEARPTDFWCNYQVRRDMEKRIEGLKENMAGCVGSETLSSPVHLPYVGVHIATWANKTLQQKHAEVVVDLQMFQGGVQRARSQTILQCQTSLLETLERYITNHLTIVNRLQIQTGMVTPSPPTVQNHSSQTSLNIVLEHYGKLFKGKLEHLAFDLQDSICHVEHRTSNTKIPFG